MTFAHSIPNLLCNISFCLVNYLVLVYTTIANIPLVTVSQLSCFAIFSRLKCSRKNGRKTYVKKTSEGIFICHCITREGAGAVLHSVEGLSARGEVKGESRPVLGSIQRQGTSGGWTLWRPPSSASTSPRIRALTSSSTACVPVEAAVVEVLLARKRGRGGGHLAVLGGGSHAAPAILVEHKHSGATLQTRVSTLARPVSER